MEGGGREGRGRGCVVRVEEKGGEGVFDPLCFQVGACYFRVLHAEGTRDQDFVVTLDGSAGPGRDFYYESQESFFV